MLGAHRDRAVAQRPGNAQSDRRGHSSFKRYQLRAWYTSNVLRSVRIAKRAIDVVGASVGLALAAPLLPMIAAAIYLDSPGPILFRQRRAGSLQALRLGRDAAA